MSVARSYLCTSCGSESPAEQRYCGWCGHELDPASRDTIDEIRTATVLFADVAHFTRLTERLGLEAIKALMDRVFERLFDVIVRHGGVVDKYIGDCVMSLFGAPIAYGDDAARAVRAGLAIQQALTDLADELEAAGLPRVRMRIGIDSGPVIAGAVGAGPQRRYTVMGSAVNGAAHLQAAAPVGAVAIGSGTFQRVRGLFELRPMDGSDPQAYEVLATRPGGLWLAPGELFGSERPMVGREAELRRLLELVDAVSERREAHLALVVGGPGVGKTRLATELLAALEQQQAPVMSIAGFADPLSANAPFSVAADAIRRKLGLSLEQPAAGALARLRDALAELGCELLAGDEEVLGRVLGAADRSNGGFSPARFSQRSHALLATIVDQLTEITPLVIVVDDMHWCDGSTLQLLEQLVDRLSDRPLLIIGLARPELLHDRPHLLDGPRRHRIELRPLSEAAVTELLDRIVGQPLRERLMPLAASTLGNPHHLAELLRSLQERRYLRREMSGWQLAGIPEDLALPEDVEAITQVRIDHLSRSQRGLLRNAAAIGPTFWAGALDALAPEMSALDLSALVLRELVIPAQQSRFSGQREYRFLNEATREVAYRMIPESQRAALHLRVGAWLEAQGVDTAEDVALTARHLDLGGAPARAAQHFRRAGELAYAGAAYEAAVAHLSRAIELVEAEELLFELLAQRERVFNALGRWTEQLADARRMDELAPEPGGRRVEALLRLGRAHLNLGEHREARAAFEQAREQAGERDDADGSARAARWLAMVHFNRSEHREALPLFEQALALAERSGNGGLAAELAYELGVTAGTVGDYVGALEASRRALAMYRTEGNRYQEAFCLGNLGCFHIYLGEYEEAVTVLEQAAELGRSVGIPLAEASAIANLGHAYRYLGEPAHAIELEQTAYATACAIGDGRLAADARLYAALAAGTFDPVAGERFAREALDAARAGGMQGAEAAAAAALARCLDALGRRDEALLSSANAVRLLEQVGSVEGLEPEIRLVHARLCAAAGRGDEAATVLGHARADLLAKAARISSEVRRGRFLAVEVNAEIISGAPGA